MEIELAVIIPRQVEDEDDNYEEEDKLLDSVKHFLATPPTSPRAVSVDEIISLRQQKRLR